MFSNNPGDYDGYNERWGGLPALRKAIEAYRVADAKVRHAEQALSEKAVPILQACVDRCQGLCCRNIHPADIITEWDLLFILAAAPQIEDAMAMLSPVNVPGTFDNHRNWQRKLRWPMCASKTSLARSDCAAKSFHASWAMTRSLCSGMPSTKAPISRRITCGFWEVV